MREASGHTCGLFGLRSIENFFELSSDYKKRKFPIRPGFGTGHEKVDPTFGKLSLWLRLGWEARPLREVRLHAALLAAKLCLRSDDMGPPKALRVPP